MDILAHEDLSISNEMMAHYCGVGRPINWSEPYILMIQHPVTTSYGNGFIEVSQTLNALKKIPRRIQKVVMWPNVDAGSDDVSGGSAILGNST